MRRLRRWLIFFFVAGMIMTAVSLCSEAEGEAYDCRLTDEKTVALTHYHGEEEWVEVPQKIEERLVSCLDEGCFERETEVQGIALPDSITVIGEKAFAHCENLSEISMYGSVESIGKDAFSDCPSLSVVRFYGTPEDFQYVRMDQATWRQIREKVQFYCEIPQSPEEPEEELPNSFPEQRAAVASVFAPEKEEGKQYVAMIVVVVAAVVVLVIMDLIIRRNPDIIRNPERRTDPEEDESDDVW